jgi:hypothetical protein
VRDLLRIDLCRHSHLSLPVHPAPHHPPGRVGRVGPEPRASLAVVVGPHRCGQFLECLLARRV